MINYNNMLARLNNSGGISQHDRMIQDKKESFERAAKYSYQGAKISKLNETDKIPALINASKISADYDEKILSVSYDYGFKTGDSIEWLDPVKNYCRTYWIIYLQDIAELAYFYASIRKCNYLIQWQDNGILYNSYVSVQGPNETNIKSFGKSQFTMDIPNYSIRLLIPNTENNLQFFQRYTKFYLSHITGEKIDTCWRVESVDSLTLPGVLSVVAQEYYADKNQNEIILDSSDTLVDNNQNNIDKEIVGDNFIKPKFVYDYVYNGDGIINWYLDPNLPIRYTIEDNKIHLEWIAAYSGEFILSCGNSYKKIVVKSMF